MTQLAETIRTIQSAGRPRYGVADAAAHKTRQLLVGGALAGPLFIVMALFQAATRPGFDITRHAVSLLSNGSWGWVQIATFLVTGLLSLMGAAGVRRALQGTPGCRWLPALLAVFGAGLFAAGLFRADPANGFPPGTAATASAVTSWHGAGHLIAGSASFLALIAACFVLARVYAVRGRRWSAVASGVVAVLFAAGLANGAGPDGPLTLFLGVSLAWLWITVTELCLIRASDRHRAAAAAR
jgi:hypothetical protein